MNNRTPLSPSFAFERFRTIENGHDQRSGAGGSNRGLTLGTDPARCHSPFVPARVPIHTFQVVEQRIVDALFEIIDGLIGRAKEGDAKAAIYLCDRILGKTTGAKVAPAARKTGRYSQSVPKA